MPQKELSNIELKLLQEELQKANNRLPALQEFGAHIEASFSKLSELRAMASDPGKIEELRSPLRERNILALYHALTSELSKFSMLLQRLEGIHEENLLFLERFRERREYSFSTPTLLRSFVWQIFSLYGISPLIFKPEFLGLFNLDQLCEDTKLQKHAGIGARLEADDLPVLFDYLHENSLSRDFFLEGADIRMRFAGNSLSVDAPAEKQRRIARLYKEMQAASPLL